MHRVFHTPLMAAFLAASMRGTQVALPSNEPKLRAPSYSKLTPRNVRRRQKVAAAKSQRAAERNASNRKAKILHRNWRRNQNDKAREQQAVINKMTNWERNQWAKAGYPDEAAEFTKHARAAMHRLHPEQAVVMAS